MNRPPSGRHERLQGIFTFLVLFSGVMFLIRPDPTRAGVIGLLWLKRRKHA